MSNEASSSSRNAHKRGGGAKDLGTGGGGKDRLGDLPDGILGSILSSFPTKEAVRTSILSTRWRYVWTSVPHIEIVDDHYKMPRISLEYRECFRDFVDRVLRLNNVPCLPKMVLSCRGDYNGRRLPEWIRALTVRDIDELVLKYVGRPHIKLPHCLFMCKKLVILNLHDCFVLDVPTSVCLVHLKVLRLFSVQIFDENTMQNLLAGCPVIEELSIDELVLDWDWSDRTKALHIQSSSLKKLGVIAQCSYFHENLRIFIDAPNLERLNVSIDSQPDRFDVVYISNVSSLVAVELDVREFSSDYFIELLNKISNTKYLKLSFLPVQPLDSANLNHLPMFHYLTDLVVVDYNWSILAHLLRCLPNLITLDYRHCQYGSDEEDEFRMLNCSMLHLESVNVHKLHWSKYEMDMVKYFLKYAPVLKTMSIYFVGRPEDSNLRNELVTLPRSSTDCDLKIYFK